MLSSGFAANLAVRWHPSLEKIDFIQKVAGKEHGLFEFDLASRQSRQIFPHTSEALIFDWSSPLWRANWFRQICILV